MVLYLHERFLVVMKLQLNKKFSVSSLTVFLLHSLLAVVLTK